MSLLPIKVLLIEDNPADARQIRKVLTETRMLDFTPPGFDLEWVDQLAAGLQRLAAGGVDVVLLDLVLPDSQGLGTFTAVHTQVPEVPVVVLTGLNDEGLALEALRQGAQDYLIKGQVADRLLARAIRYAIERRRVEDALRRSQERLRSIFVASPDCIYLTDTAGNILEANSTLLEQVGLSLEEMRRRNVLEFFAQDDPTELLEAAARLQSGEGVKGIEVRARTALGDVLDYEIHAIPLKKDGTVSEVLGVARDVTQRRRAEREIRRQNEELAALNKVAAMVNRSLDLDQILGSALDAVLRLDIFGDRAQATIFLLDEGTGKLVPALDHHDTQDHLCLYEPSHVTNCLCGLAARSGEVVICEDCQQDLRHSCRLPEMPPHKDICLPLKARGKVLGVMAVWLPISLEITARDIDLLLAVSDQIGVAIENAQLFEIVARGKREWEGTFDAIADGIYIHDADFRIVRVNQALAEWLDTTPQSLAGRNCYEVICGLAEPPAYCPLPDAIFDAQPVGVERELPYLDGVFHISIFPLRGEEGESTGAIHVLRNITEHKRAEEELRYQAYLLENVSDAIISSDRNLRIQSWNRAAEEIYGWHADEAIGRLSGDVLRSPYSSGQHDIMEQLSAHGYWKGEVVHRHKDGTLIHILSSVTLLRDEEGNPTGFVSANRDITERVRTDEALRRRNEELAALNAVATVVNESRDLTSLLSGVLRMAMGISRTQTGAVWLLDEQAQELVVAADQNCSPEFLKQIDRIKLGERAEGLVAVTGEPLLIEDFDKAEGISIREKQFQSLICVPLKCEGEVLGVMSVISHRPDILDLQAVELLGNIANQVAVAVEKVRLAERAAEVKVLRELDRLRSELIANVSHELRTPLGLIEIFCTTLLREDMDLDPETQREFLQDIARETDSLERIVDHLLDLSQIESTRLRIDKCPTDVGRLIREVIEPVQARRIQHQLVLDLPVEPLMAVVDPKRIAQVLRNLVDNAIKYSLGGGTVTVRGRKDGDKLLIQVSDQGVGIPEEDLERVFERFYRVENEVTLRERGAGLGLALCRGIVEAHDGRIWAESTLAVGSTLSFTLPTDTEE